LYFFVVEASPQTTQLLAIMRTVYQQVAASIPEMFEARATMNVGTISEVSVDHVFVATTVTVQGAAGENAQPVNLTCLPRANQSLKVLSEIPLFLILLFQMHRNSVIVEVVQTLPFLMSTISTYPSEQQR
jgi:hypothetical protein